MDSDEELTADADRRQSSIGCSAARSRSACNHLTMFIDVQANAAVLSSWRPGRTISPATWSTTAPIPDQQRPYFTLRDARRTLAAWPQAAGLEGAIYAGLEALTGRLLRPRMAARRRGRCCGSSGA